ncbi:hypothetical protein JNO48_07600 [Clostridiales bacterium]|nr:hypothetical protein JNO48_07600 [Clostridiales bacterium]
MGYLFDHKALQSLIYEMNAQKPVWDDGLDIILERAQKFSESKNITGKGATNIKNYLKDIYPMIINDLKTNVYDLDAAIACYNNAFLQIDGGDGTEEALVRETEMEGFSEGLASRRGPVQDMDYSVRQALNSIRHIEHIPYETTEQFEKELRKLYTRVSDINDDIKAMEAKYAGEAIEKLQGSIKAVIAMLQDQINQDISKYTPEAMMQNQAYREMVRTYNELYDEIEANEEQIRIAQESKGEMLQALYEKRLEEANKAKFFMQVLCVVASVAVTVATGGAAAPLVMVATGAITGAVSAGWNSYWDQTVGTPACPGKPNWGTVFKDAAVGGATGAVTSAIGCGAGEIGKQLTKGVTSELGKLAIQGVVGGGKKVLSGIAADTIEMIGNGENPLEHLDQVFDPKKLGTNFVSGSVSGITSTATKDLMKGIAPRSMDDSLLERAFKDGVAGGVSDLTSGVAGRFSSAYLSTGDMGEAWRTSTNPRDLMIDFGAGAATEIGLGYKDWKMDQLQKKTNDEVRAKQPKEGVEERARKKGMIGVKEGEAIGEPVFEDGEEVYLVEDAGKISSKKYKNEETFKRLQENGYLDESAVYDDKTGKIWAKDPNTNQMVEIQPDYHSTDQGEKNTQLYHEMEEKGLIDKNQYKLDEETGRVTRINKDGSETEVNLRSNNIIHKNENGEKLTVKFKPANTGDKAADRIEDNCRMYDAMVESGKLDEHNSYIDRESGNIYIRNPETGVETRVTMHHRGDFDVRTGELTGELVTQDSHGHIHHAGGRDQADIASKNGWSEGMAEKYQEDSSADSMKRSGAKSIRNNLRPDEIQEEKYSSGERPARYDMSL